MYPYGKYVRQLHNATRQRIDAALDSMELTSAQGLIIGFLMRSQSPPCPRDIEQEFHLSHATVSGLLSRMEKKGFIRQEADASDRRCKRIFPLEKAKECGGRIYRTIVETEAQMVQDFTEEERRLFAGFLSRAAHNMGICEINCENENKEETAK